MQHTISEAKSTSSQNSINSQDVLNSAMKIKKRVEEGNKIIENVVVEGEETKKKRKDEKGKRVVTSDLLEIIGL